MIHTITNYMYTSSDKKKKPTTKELITKIIIIKMTENNK